MSFGNGRPGITRIDCVKIRFQGAFGSCWKITSKASGMNYALKGISKKRVLDLYIHRREKVTHCACVNLIGNTYVLAEERNYDTAIALTQKYSQAAQHF